jgi:hypothetical protein
MIMTIPRMRILLCWRRKLHIFRLTLHTVWLQVVVVSAVVVVAECLMLALVILVALIGGHNFLAVHDTFLLEVL